MNGQKKNIGELRRLGDLISLSIVVVLFEFAFFALASDVSASWPMIGQNPQHTGYSPMKGNSAFYQIKWRKFAGTSDATRGSSVAAFDVDGDGKEEMGIIGARTMYDGNGNVMWGDEKIYCAPGKTCSEPGGVCSMASFDECQSGCGNGASDWCDSSGDGGTPVLADVNQDGKIELLAWDWRHTRIYSRDAATGHYKWYFDWDDSEVSLDLNAYRREVAPVVDDIDLDGKKDILVVGTKLFVINGYDGSVKWKIDTPGGTFAVPAIGDINNDGQKEVVMEHRWNTGGAPDGDLGVRAWDKNGNEIWQRTFLVDRGGSYLGYPVVADVVAANPGNEVIVETYGTLYVLKGSDGSTIWEKVIEAVDGNSPYPTWSASPAVADVDNDGKLDIVLFVEIDGKSIAAFRGDGTEIWKTFLEGNMNSGPTIVDIDNDGNREILVPTKDSGIYILNKDGTIRQKIDVNVKHESFLTVLDADGDSWAEIAFVDDNRNLVLLDESIIPEIQFSAISSSKAESAGVVNLQIVVSAAPGSNATVDYAVTGGTATGGGVDYALANGTATILPGSVSTQISVAITNDTIVEPDETVIITLSNPVNAILGANNTHTLTVVDDDAAGMANLEGFAWSDSIGWISFSSKDCDLDGNGFFGDVGAPAGCPAAGAAYQYGVWKSVANELAGYAWSDNLGWINFSWPDIKDMIGNMCPGGDTDGACRARFNAGDSQFYGWARACSVFANGCSGALKPSVNTGGWDGWISLNCADKSGLCGTSNYKVALNSGKLSGWGWGSEVVGWISFCGINGSDSNNIPYCVSIKAGNNKPIVNPLPQAEIDYCSKDLPGAVNLKWQFNDLEDGYGMQTAYEVELEKYKAGAVISVCQPGKQGFPLPGVPDHTTSLLGTQINAFCPGFISYGGFTYKWKIKVFDRDNNENEGGFVKGDDFPYSSTVPNPRPTPTHGYPIANFSVNPSSGWLELMPITFDPFDATVLGLDVTRTFGGATIVKLVWDFGDSDTYTESPVVAPYNKGNHDVQKSDYNAGVYTVDLQVTDSESYACWASQSGHEKTITILSNKPKWNEAVP